MSSDRQISQTNAAITEEESAAMVSDILNLIVPAALSLSPDGTRVVYSTRLKWNHRIGEHTIASIWIGETAVYKSARRLTKGAWNDRSPQWAPDSRSVAFVSDRGGRGSACAIYLVSLDEEIPKAVTPIDMNGIPKLAFSPDGRHIAFIALSKTPSKQKTMGVTVWGKDWKFARLFLVEPNTGTIRVLFDQEAHVEDFAWTNCGTEIAVVTHRTPHVESKYLHGTTISILRVKDGTTRTLCHIPSAIVFDPVWLGSSLYFLTNNIPELDISGFAVYSVREGEPYRKIAHGETDCPAGLTRAGDDIAVHVEDGPYDRLRLLIGDKTMFSQKKRVVLFDISCSAKNKLQLAVAQGDVNHPTEVFSVDLATGKTVQLSNHGCTFAGREFGHCAFTECQTTDGKERLDGLYLIPAQHMGTDRKPIKPLPTLVLLHGGPYCRMTDTFDAWDPFYFLIQPLLSEGYGILIPNYRGSSGRGERFASYVRGGIGLYDEPDIVAMVQDAIVRGYADKSRLVVAGWSQGGHLSFLSAVRNGAHGLGWRFCGAIAGAGVTDWEALALTSDVGYMQAQTVGGAPWNTDRTDVRTRRGSALWEFKDAVRDMRIPPILILHGAEDERVPVTQAWGFRRALDEAGLPFEFVTYQNEGHYFVERRHIEDLATRILSFVRKQLTHHRSE